MKKLHYMDRVEAERSAVRSLKKIQFLFSAYRETEGEICCPRGYI